MTQSQDPHLIRFIRLFNDQFFFEAHEILEEAWLQRSGEEKSFYQGLIQCAVALEHWKRKNPIGAAQVGARALAILERFGAKQEGIEIRELVEDVRKFLDQEKTEFPKIVVR